MLKKMPRREYYTLWGSVGWFNAPLRITFAKFIHPEEKEKEPHESHSRPDNQLSNDSLRVPSREENEGNEENEGKRRRRKLKEGREISKLWNSKSCEGNFGNCFDNEEYYKNWIRIFFYFTRFSHYFSFQREEREENRGNSKLKERNFGNYFGNEEYYRIIIIVEYYYRILL